MADQGHGGLAGHEAQPVGDLLRPLARAQFRDFHHFGAGKYGIQYLGRLCRTHQGAVGQ